MHEIGIGPDEMVDTQIAARGISDARLLAAMRAVPRHAFVAEELAPLAYEDRPLPIEAGQTISQPYIVARMIALAGIGAQDRVLEIGAGSGYAAAVMSRIAERVFALERHAVLASKAQQRLAALGYDNVTVYHRDGGQGLPEQAPFNAIIVSAATRTVPKALCAQLAADGRLVVPVGPRRQQMLRLIVRAADGRFRDETHDVVAFVPLVKGVDEPANGPPDRDAERR